MKILAKWLALAVLLCTMPAKAALDIVITEGVDAARPIAVMPFQWQGAGAPPQAIADVVMSDLVRSGTFKPLDELGLPQRGIGALAQFDANAWANVSAEAVVVGSVKPYGTDQFLVSFDLIDLVKAQNQALKGPASPTEFLMDSRQTVISATQFRQYGHRISDIVYEKLTGIRGAFLTRISYVLVNHSQKAAY